MRRIVGYIDGRPIWSENTPATPYASARISGSLVVGEPGWKERRKAVNPPLTANQKRSDDRPIVPGRPAVVKPPKPPKARAVFPPVPQPKSWAYPSDEDRIAARRRSWRESKARSRRAA